jgi:DNA processing protein
MDRIYLAALQMTPGIGSVRLKKMIAFFGNAENAWLARRQDLLVCKCLDETTCNKLLLLREKIDILNLADKWEKQGIRLCRFTDPEYPVLLQAIYNPPVLLYYRGQLPVSEKLIAIVGARRSSAYGNNAAHMLGSDLALADVYVVSGAARGIDTAAHKGALNKGRTIAVLGCGVDISYPPENGGLLSCIAQQGAVISEYPPGTPPHAAHFPARNRLINGLSKGIVVVEAAEKSGALITTEYALEEGRDVFAVPGSIFSQTSKGVNTLIKQGAKLIDSAADVLEEYNWSYCEKNDHTASINANEMVVMSVLSYDNPLTIEEIVLKTNLTSSVVSYNLLQLELRGLVAEHCAHCYVRAKGGI